MDEIVVNRWKRYGRDRAYASLSDGTKLGRIHMPRWFTHGPDVLSPKTIDTIFEVARRSTTCQE